MEIRSADRSKIEEAVAAYAADLRRRHAEILRVIWFGSWVTGTPTPGSDVDLCLVLRAAEKPGRQRIPDYLPDRGFPVGLDLFPYTEAELAQLAELSPGWYAAIASGREI